MMHGEFHAKLQPVKKLDGWHVPFYLVDEEISFREYREPRFVQEERPTLEQINAEVDKQIEFAKLKLIPVPQVDQELAGLAVAAHAILALSPKLQSPEISGFLDQLAAGVVNASGLQAPPAPGVVATGLVEKMIAHPIVQAQPLLAKQLETALNNVIQMTGGVL